MKYNRGRCNIDLVVDKSFLEVVVLPSQSNQCMECTMTSVHEDKEGNYDETRNTSCLFIFLCVIYVFFRDTKLRDRRG